MITTQGTIFDRIDFTLKKPQTKLIPPNHINEYPSL